MMPTTDWSVWPHGYSILLNERIMFPEDLSLWKMRIDRSRQLFVDDYLVAHMSNVRREFYAVQKHPDNPILTDLIPGYIYPDPEGGYRLYYHTHKRRTDGTNVIAVRVALSSNGVEWEKPSLDLCEIDPDKFGGGNNNVLVPDASMHGLFYEPEESDPNERWKAIIRDYGRAGETRGWAYVKKEGTTLKEYAVNTLCVSPDGLRWNHKADISFLQLTDGMTFRTPEGRPRGIGDVLMVRWDPVLKKYIAHTKHQIGPDYRFPPINYARVVAWCESDDLIHWSSPRVYAYPDAEDAKVPGMFGIYEADGFPYESMWLGCFSMCTYNYAPEGDRLLKRNWVRLAGSRDGRHWYYLGSRKAFIPLGDEDSWEPHYTRMANLHTVGGPVVKGDELWFYYRGSRGGVRGGNWQYSMGIGILRRDGFASLNAGREPGVVITRPLVFEGEGKLYINADVGGGGYVRVSILEEDGAEIEGFGQEGCRGVGEDTTCGQVCWTGGESLASLKDRYVRLAFHLKEAKLYSFWIE